MSARTSSELLAAIDALLLRAEEDLTAAKWALVRAKLAAIHRAQEVPRETSKHLNPPY